MRNSQRDAAAGEGRRDAAAMRGTTSDDITMIVCTPDVAVIALASTNAHPHRFLFEFAPRAER